MTLQTQWSVQLCVALRNEAVLIGQLSVLSHLQFQQDSDLQY